MHYWLVKSEPTKYSWDQLCKDGSTYWDGVRNYQARNNLQAMKVGDKVLYYHSNDGLAVVGVARVTKEAYQDPTTEDERWVVVDLEPVEPLPFPITLSDIKQERRLRDIALIKQSRLSVMPVAKKEFDLIHVLANNPSLVMSREQLLNRVWGYDFDVDTNVVDVFIGYLRKKLEIDGQKRIIQTVRGVGFVLNT